MCLSIVSFHTEYTLCVSQGSQSFLAFGLTLQNVSLLALLIRDRDTKTNRCTGHHILKSHMQHILKSALYRKLYSELEEKIYNTKTRVW